MFVLIGIAFYVVWGLWDVTWTWAMLLALFGQIREDVVSISLTFMVGLVICAATSGLISRFYEHRRARPDRGEYFDDLSAALWKDAIGYTLLTFSFAIVPLSPFIHEEHWAPGFAIPLRAFASVVALAGALTCHYFASKELPPLLWRPVRVAWYGFRKRLARTIDPERS